MRVYTYIYITLITPDFYSPPPLFLPQEFLPNRQMHSGWTASSAFPEFYHQTNSDSLIFKGDQDFIFMYILHKCLKQKK